MPTPLSLPDSVCLNFAVHAGTYIVYPTGGVIIEDGDVFEGDSVTVLPDESWDTFTTSVNAAAEEAMGPRADESMIMVDEIGGITFTPGTYRRVGTINVADSQTVTLDGEGDPNSVFLFQVGTTMLTGTGCNILLINGAQAKNVLWALGTTLTTGANNVFQGSVITGGAVTIGLGTTVYGSVVAQTAITFGAGCHVYDGCVIALSVVTFGTANSVTV
jgi:hypothetical protein